MISISGVMLWIASVSLWMQMAPTTDNQDVALPQSPAEIADSQLSVATENPNTKPDDTSALHALAQILLTRCQLEQERKHYKESVALCAEALLKDPHLVAARMARAKWELGQHQEAVVDLEEAVVALPNDAPLLGQLGLWQLQLDNVVWAARHLRRSLELEPENETIRLACVAAFLENSEWQGALNLVQPLFASANVQVRSQAHFFAGIAALRINDRIQARHHLRQAHTQQADAQLQALTRSERGWERGLFFQFKLGIGVDSNPAYFQELDTVRPRTIAGHLTQPLSVTWVPRDNLKLEGNVGYHYFFAPWNRKNHEQVIAFSNLSTQISVFGRWFLFSWPWPAHVEGQLYWMTLGLQGGKGIPEEPEPFAFMELGGLQTELAVQSSLGREIALGAGISRTVYRDGCLPCCFCSTQHPSIPLAAVFPMFMLPQASKPSRCNWYSAPSMMCKEKSSSKQINPPIFGCKISRRTCCFRQCKLNLSKMDGIPLCS